MEDNYELISKEELNDLRNKLAEFEKKKKSSGSLEENKEHTTILKKIDAERKEDTKLILQKLDEIKELNKNTLSNVLDRTENLDNKLETVVKHLQELVVLLSNDITEIQDYKKEMREAGMEEIDSERILTKLTDIETFMTNLRVLLSYVKPSDLTVEKPLIDPDKE